MKLLLFVSLIATCYAYELNVAVRNFSLELLQNVDSKIKENTVISPFGIWTLMTGVASGTCGNSRAELDRVLRLPEPSTLDNHYRNFSNVVFASKNEGVSLVNKNFIFLDECFDILPDFERSITSNFGAQVIRLNFKDVNVTEKANKIIKESGVTTPYVLHSDDFGMSRMIITNLISFKGIWTTPFNETATEDGLFYDEYGNHIGTVKMMHQMAMMPFSNVRAVRAHAVEIPYGTEQKFSMLIILPYNRISVIDMYKNLTNEFLEKIFDKFARDFEDFDLDYVILELPRFRINTTSVVNNALNKMGVYDIFNQSTANFMNIANESMHVSRIIQKATIDVIESGTEAFADTTAYIPYRNFPYRFIANRPFIYIILEKLSNTILFSGIYSEPALY